ncbi:hypothetical protein P4V58_30920 [Bacillus wiedmannii]|uniref:hypothetical protein n=1 Tax=Bacillus wiedmannii TaxID=1890302 RepID=UPI002E20C1A7|nr:hypothetical protein [Bacillus wiedmannii]
MYVTSMLMIVRAFSFTLPAARGDNGNPKEFAKVNFEEANDGNAKHIKKVQVFN